MPDLLRQEVVAAATIVVVKVGTRVLTHDDGTLDETIDLTWAELEGG